jgi:WD40 repeat protein
VATLEPIGRPIPVEAPTSSLAFSPDGTLLAAGSSADTVTLIDTERGTSGPPQRLGATGFVFVTFSPDGRRLVAASGSGRTFLFDLTADRPSPRIIPGSGGEIVSAAFSPDGRLAVTGSFSGTVQFRDPETFAALGAPVPSTDRLIFRLAFSPDSSLLVAGDFDLSANASARLIDVATRQPLGGPIRGLAGAVSFSPDSSTLALPAADTTLLWDLDPATWRERACDIAGHNLTPVEEREYLPNDPDTPPTCSRYPG